MSVNLANQLAFHLAYLQQSPYSHKAAIHDIIIQAFDLDIESIYKFGRRFWYFEDKPPVFDSFTVGDYLNLIA